MGGNRGWWKLPERTGSEREAEYRWREVRTIEGIKVLESKYQKNGALPRYSNTPYTKNFHQNSKGNIDQLRIFRGRNSFLDIDWGHGHGSIPKGTPHVQQWKFDSKTQKLTRIGTERPMSDYMWKKYGKAIMKADPNIKRE